MRAQGYLLLLLGIQFGSLACSNSSRPLASNWVTVGIAGDDVCEVSILPLLRSAGIEVEFDPGAVRTSGVEVLRVNAKRAKELILEDARAKKYHFIEIDVYRQRHIDDLLAQESLRQGLKKLENPDSSYSLDWAIAYFDGSLRLRPDNPTAYGARALARLRRGDKDGAREDLQKAEDLRRSGIPGDILPDAELDQMRAEFKPP